MKKINIKYDKPSYPRRLRDIFREEFPELAERIEKKKKKLVRIKLRLG